MDKKMTILNKKLIEVALPLEAINVASAREKSIRHGHPSTLHLWWARRPLAAARAVIFAQMVDDPSSHPELFPTEEAQENERQRLFGIIEELVKWENTTNEKVLEKAREEIRRSWRLTCETNKDHPQAAELFNPEKLPGFHDPFAGGGALPLEAQRLGLESYASDLNPVAVLINKAMIEIPPKFAGRPPVSISKDEKQLFKKEWHGAEGLAEDVRHYGAWMREEAEKRIGHLYPKVEITPEMAEERPDLKNYVGKKLTVIAWLWARTVKSPNPAFANVDVPLVSTFMLSTKTGKEAYVEPVIDAGSYSFTVKVGKPGNPEAAKNGTKMAKGANFKCIISGVPISGDYIKSEGQAGRMAAKLMAIVAEGERGRVYLSPLHDIEKSIHQIKPLWRPEGNVPSRLTGGTCVPYGMREWGDLFTSRQLVALSTFSDLVLEAREKAKKDAIAAGMPDDGHALDSGGTGAQAYADAVAVYLAFVIDKQADLGNSLCRWEPVAQCPRQLFGRQAIPMIWDFAESNPLGNSSGAWIVFIDGFHKAFLKGFETVKKESTGIAIQFGATTQDLSKNKAISTDPPYYDNIGYADLSDFFYNWLRRTLKTIFPSLFGTLATPKADELVATPYRHGSKEKAESFFMDGMTKAMTRLSSQAHPSFPVTIYYAFKQSETSSDAGTASTGWETFLDAVIKADFSLCGTWPMRTENSSRMIGQGTNALASSIVLVCRKKPESAPTATRRDFVSTLRAELPEALLHLQRGNIAPVDLAQASIGPGMSVFTRYSSVIDAQGKPLSVRDALMLINQTLDELLEEQEGDFDADTRWALSWFEQFGFNDGSFGDAETLSKAKNTSVSGMVEAGIAVSGSGRVRLLRPDELPADWDPTKDSRLTVWEAVHHLVRALSTGEQAAAVLAAKLGSMAETARELAYRLYSLCERRKRAQDALSYNSLVQSWPEIMRLASEAAKNTTDKGQMNMFD